MPYGHFWIWDIFIFSLTWPHTSYLATIPSPALQKKPGAYFYNWGTSGHMWTTNLQHERQAQLNTTPSLPFHFLHTHRCSNQLFSISVSVQWLITPDLCWSAIQMKPLIICFMFWHSSFHSHVPSFLKRLQNGNYQGNLFSSWFLL